MKRIWPILPVLVSICAGCVQREVRPVDGPDYMYREAYGRLRDQQPPVPERTPCDDDAKRRAAFLRGFCRGWTVTRDYWLGNLISAPVAYQGDEAAIGAWAEGYAAGRNALCASVVDPVLLPSSLGGTAE